MKYTDASKIPELTIWMNFGDCKSAKPVKGGAGWGGELLSLSMYQLPGWTAIPWLLSTQHNLQIDYSSLEVFLKLNSNCTYYPQTKETY